MKYNNKLIALSALLLFTVGCEPEKKKDAVVIRPVKSVNELFGNQPQAVSSSNSSATGASGLNPAHGQPGHNCAIAVGAPLNSASQAKTTTLTSPTTSAQPTITTAPVASAPGLNPAHGQPGHDCAIAVGAPLKK